MTPDKLAMIKARHKLGYPRAEWTQEVTVRNAHTDRADLLAYVETLKAQLNASQLLAKVASDELEKVTKERDDAREAAEQMKAYYCPTATLPWEVKL